MGDEQEVRLVAVRLSLAGRPGQDRQIDQQRQEKERRWRPKGQTIAKQRSQGSRQPGDMQSQQGDEAGDQRVAR